MLHELSRFLIGHLGDGKSSVSVSSYGGHPALRVNDEGGGLMMEISPFGNLEELPEIEVFGAAWNEEGFAEGSMTINSS